MPILLSSHETHSSACSAKGTPSKSLQLKTLPALSHLKKKLKKEKKRKTQISDEQHCR